MCVINPQFILLGHRLRRRARSTWLLHTGIFYPQRVFKHLRVNLSFWRTEFFKWICSFLPKVCCLHFLWVLLPSFSFWLFLHEAHAIPWTHIMLLRKIHLQIVHLDHVYPLQRSRPSGPHLKIRAEGPGLQREWLKDRTLQKNHQTSSKQV